MDLKEVISALSSAIGVVIVLGISFINIPKININFWELIGKSINKEVSNKISLVENDLDDIRNRLENHIHRDEEYKIKEARLRILHFSSDLLNGEIPTKEHEEDIINDIDSYEDYCLEHPNFPNNKAMISINYIKLDYAKRLLNNNFKC